MKSSEPTVEEPGDIVVPVSEPDDFFSTASVPECSNKISRIKIIINDLIIPVMESEVNTVNIESGVPAG